MARGVSELRGKAWRPTRTLLVAALPLVVLASDAPAAGSTRTGAVRTTPGQPNSNVTGYKLDRELDMRASVGNPLGTTRVIVEWQPGAIPPTSLRRLADLPLINGSVLAVPNGLLRGLASNPSVLRIHYDRPAFKHDLRTNVTIGAYAVQRALGYTGAGIGVAVIDSGITPWHDDLTGRSSEKQRVSAFVDFVNGLPTPYDDDGHGSHVAGIIAGNGYDSNGQNAGVAPDANLIVLKALDAQGHGTISTIIQALDWVLANHTPYNIRVVNLSVGSAIRESYWTDPLTLAAKRLVDAGIVVVSAAGNLGLDAQGVPQYGGIGAPGNAPWVLTVGASSTLGTPAREDDTMASFSSRGPTYLDWAAKPDLVAPGVGTVSLAVPGSSLYESRAAALLSGSVPTPAFPYLSLSGTSMAAPVVSGTIAAMLQANPALTPNAVKAILQYTAQSYPGYDSLTEGAGFLNAVGAVRLARFYATAEPGQVFPVQAIWSRHIIWGNHQLTGGVPDPSANAFSLGASWGAPLTGTGDNIVWGMVASGDNIVWGMSPAGNIVWGTVGPVDNIVWGTANGNDNIVWGTDCGGADCDNIVWGTVGADNIVWGTAQSGNDIVWGTAGLNPDNIVWGMGEAVDNIVWGMGALPHDNIVWGMVPGVDNIVWGVQTGADNIVWGTVNNPSAIWDATANTPIDWSTLTWLFAGLSDEQVFRVLAALTAAP